MFFAMCGTEFGATAFDLRRRDRNFSRPFVIDASHVHFGCASLRFGDNCPSPKQLESCTIVLPVTPNIFRTFAYSILIVCVSARLRIYIRSVVEITRECNLLSSFCTWYGVFPPALFWSTRAVSLIFVFCFHIIFAWTKSII